MNHAIRRRRRHSCRGVGATSRGCAASPCNCDLKPDSTGRPCPARPAAGARCANACSDATYASSSSLIIRALALGQLGPSDWGKVLWRELAVGLALGALLSLVGFARTLFFGHVSDPVTMGLIVATSITAVVSLGTLVGALMPLLIKRLGLDPAVSSAPFVASLVDVFGLVVYFSVSRYLLAVTA